MITEVQRKRRRKKSIFSLISTVILTTLIILTVVRLCQLFFSDFSNFRFIPTPYGKKVSENVKKAQSAEIPDWIDSQIISVHLGARTGAHLNDIKNIVIHYVGNPDITAQNNRDYYDKLTTDVSSHFVVGLDGEIIQCVPLWEKSAASNHRNGDTISIEACHPDESGRFNNETYNSVIKLSAWLCNEFGLDEKDIIRHYDITEKICPKYYVENPDEWKNLKKDVKERLDSYED